MAPGLHVALSRAVGSLVLQTAHDQTTAPHRACSVAASNRKTNPREPLASVHPCRPYGARSRFAGQPKSCNSAPFFSMLDFLALDQAVYGRVVTCFQVWGRQWDA